MNTDLKKNKVRFCLHTFMYWIDGLHFCTLEPAFFLMSLLFVYTISLFQILLCQLFLFLSLPEYLFFIKINWYMHWNNLVDHRNLFRSHLTLWSHTYSLWKTKRKARPNDYRIKTTAQNNNRKKLCVFFWLYTFVQMLQYTDSSQWIQGIDGATVHAMERNYTRIPLKQRQCWQWDMTIHMTHKYVRAHSHTPRAIHETVNVRIGRSIIVFHRTQPRRNQNDTTNARMYWNCMLNLILNYVKIDVDSNSTLIHWSTNSI